jgi:hypothetical protein
MANAMTGYPSYINIGIWRRKSARERCIHNLAFQKGQFYLSRAFPQQRRMRMLTFKHSKKRRMAKSVAYKVKNCVNDIISFVSQQVFRERKENRGILPDLEKLGVYWCVAWYTFSGTAPTSSTHL